MKILSVEFTNIVQNCNWLNQIESILGCSGGRRIVSTHNLLPDNPSSNPVNIKIDDLFPPSFHQE